MLSPPVLSAPSSIHLRVARWVLLHAVLPLTLVALVVNTLVPAPPTPADPVAYARLLVDAGAPQRAVWELRRALDSRPDDARLHRALLAAHFRVPIQTSRNTFRDDRGMRERYEEMTRSTASHTRELGHYGLGFFHYYAHDPQGALDEWERIEHSTLSGLALGRATALNILGRHREALPQLDSAVHDADGEIVARAHGEHATALLGLAEWDALDAHIANHPDHIPSEVVGSHLLHHHQFAAYLAHFVGYFATGVRWPLALVVVLGSAMWFQIIRGWDHFKTQPLVRGLLVLVAGALAAQLLYLVRDVAGLLLHVGPTGAWATDAVYYVFWVGVLEEAVKLLPLVVLARLGRSPRDPVDWVFLGGLSALGFATYENLLYAGAMGSSTVLARSFTSTPLHVFMTGTIALAISEAAVRGWSQLATVAAAFSVVAVYHGAFDTFASRTSGLWGWLAFLMLWLGGLFFMTGLGHAMSNSVSRPDGALLPGVDLGAAFRPVMRAAFLMVSIVILADAFTVPASERVPMAAGHLLRVNAASLCALLLASYHVRAEWVPGWPRHVVKTAATTNT